MVVTAYWYAKAFLSAFNAEIDVDNAIYCAMTTSGYTPNQDTHDYFNDVTNEVADTNYTSPGYLITTPTKATANNVFTFDSTDDPTWTSDNPGSITARRAVYHDYSTAAAATAPLICWVDFGADQVAQNGGTFVIQQAGTGIATITATDATGFP